MVQFRAAPPGTPLSVNTQGVAILLVEQNAKVALKLADYGYVLETRKIVIEGDGATLRQDESIVKAYLGSGRH